MNTTPLNRPESLGPCQFAAGFAAESTTITSIGAFSGFIVEIDE